jgi:hypothetical protein
MIIHNMTLIIVIILVNKFQIVVPTLSSQAIVLTVAGFLGGIFSSVAGSGVDICSFSILSLLFRSARLENTKKCTVALQGERKGVDPDLNCADGSQCKCWYEISPQPPNYSLPAVLLCPQASTGGR